MTEKTAFPIRVGVLLIGGVILFYNLFGEGVSAAWWVLLAAVVIVYFVLNALSKPNESSGEEGL